jgi:hypothetical protein
MKSLIFIFQSFSYVSPLFAISIYCLNKTFLPKYISVLIWFLLSCIIFDTICLVMWKAGISNHGVAQIYDSVQFLAVAILHTSFKFQKRKKFKYFIFVCSGVYAVLVVLILLAGYSNLHVVLSNIMVWFICVVYLRSISDPPILNIARFPPFWISFGFMLYCSLTLWIVARDPSNPNLINIWVLHNFMTIIKNFCFLLAVWYASNTNPPLAKRFFSDN